MRRSRMGRPLLFSLGSCALALALAACSLMVDLSGLSEPGAASAEAGSGGPSDGAAGDGGSPTDGSDTHYCAAHADASACIDFDDGGTVAPYFGATGFDSRVTSTIDLAPPTSLSFAYPGGTLPNGALAHYASRPMVTTVTKSARVGLRLRVDATDSNRNVRAFTFALNKGSGVVYMYVTVSTGSSILQVQIYSGSTITSDTQETFASKIPLGTWTRLELAVDATQSPATVTPLLDGVAVGAPMSFNQQLAVGAAPAIAPELTMYGSNGMTLAPTQFHFDDLLAEIQ